MKAGQRAGGYRVKVGLPNDAQEYPDGTSVIMVGAIHEFGSDDGTIPERSWLRSAVIDNQPELRQLAEDLARAVTQGRISPEAALEKLGLRAVSLIQEQITGLTSPANKASTIKAKGSSNPLVDTGHLVQSITHRVIGPGE